MKATILAAALAAAPSAAMAQSTDPVEAGGAYAGVHVAYASRNSDWLDLGVGPLGDHDAKGGQVGVQAGYDLDLGPVFIGVNASATPMGQSGQHIDRVFGTMTPNTEREHSREKWNARATARIGTKLGAFRLYAKGGVALSRKRYELTGYFAPDVVFAETTSTRTGWVIGGGVERRLSRRFSAFADYSYADFGRKLENIRCTATYPSCGSLDPTLVPVALKETSHRIELGLNYHF